MAARREPEAGHRLPRAEPAPSLLWLCFRLRSPACEEAPLPLEAEAEKERGFDEDSLELQGDVELEATVA